MKISINVPTYNESKQIGTLVNNVKEVADEIILIDNSKDDTVRIAKKSSNKVKIVHYEIKDFSKIRNEGIKNVKKEWYILYLDSDELLSKELIKSLNVLKQRNENLADAYLIKRSHYFNYGTYSAHLTTRLIKGEPKLFKKGIIRFVNVSHEKPVFIKESNKIETIKGDTLHYPITGKYNTGSTYLKMHINGTIKENKFNKELKNQLKQLIKYILIFDYNPKYWRGNIKFWIESVRYTSRFIKEYMKTLKTSQELQKH